ncbi:APC family permease [Rhodococcus fascians]|nr:APC family permease [Rhodococcus fascians]MBY4140894.1 APC family permease [Rhodococcus fascians]MBY4219558.1 APC family permease [Rhodococcus fascians]MBY4221867.1 APC family permease [Rhodococcus fascians]MBY4233868.1 APC family permease [Rhodococcus fascians]
MGTPALVVFGLAYMAPMAVFTTYGVVNELTAGHVPAAYLITLVAMLFTAASYAVLVRAYPVAGSAYAYARRAFGGSIGFLTGWALMLDYLLLPLTNYLLIGVYLNASFPAVPTWAYALGAVVLVTTLSVVGVGVVRSANLLLVGIQVIFVAVFAVLALIYLNENPGVSILTPIYSQGIEAAGLFTGAATLALSFLGFDAVSTMSEEARDPRRTVPRAIMLTVLVGGVIFFVVSMLATLIEPDPSAIANPDTAAIEIMAMTAGHWLQTFFLASYLAACIAAALAAQTSVTRILYAMGRDGVLFRRVFGYLSPRFRTPIGAVLFVGIVSVPALSIDLAALFSIVSFGALAAFSLVNLSVIKNFLIDSRQRGARNVAIYGIVPGIGFLLTVYLWFSLSALALTVGLSWLAIGAIYLAWLTRGFRRPPPEVAFDAEHAAAEHAGTRGADATLER